MRKITELVWHCTATPEGREVSAKEIDRWHKERGWSGIGYHKVVHLDGTVSEGRPESKIGAHVAGRNSGTLGYVYVGGLDRNGKPKDTRTPAQKATMRRLTQEAIARYGLTRISGHREYANKACPCFDARGEYSRFLPGIGKVKPVRAGALPDTFDRDVGMPETDPAKDIRRNDIASGTAVATGGVGAAATLAEITEKIEPLAYYSDLIMYVFLGMTLAGVGLFVWSRLRNR